MIHYLAKRAGPQLNHLNHLVKMVTHFQASVLGYRQCLIQYAVELLPGGTQGVRNDVYGSMTRKNTIKGRPDGAPLLTSHLLPLRDYTVVGIVVAAATGVATWGFTATWGLGAALRAAALVLT